MERKWLVAKRIENRLTQKDVAQMIGAAQATYCQIEKGDRNPSVMMAKKIADALGFAWTEFFNEDARGPEGQKGAIPRGA